MVIAGQKQQRFSEIRAGLDDADGLVIRLLNFASFGFDRKMLVVCCYCACL